MKNITKIIIGFPRIGKTRFIRENDNFISIDMEKYLHIGNKTMGYFPIKNILKSIKDNYKKADFIIINYNFHMIEYFDKIGLKYSLFYPKRSTKEEYSNRFEFDDPRYKGTFLGNEFKSFISNWDKMIDECNHSKSNEKYCINGYLSDYIVDIAEEVIKKNYPKVFKMQFPSRWKYTDFLLTHNNTSFFKYFKNKKVVSFIR